MSRAVVAAARSAGMPVPPADDFRALPIRGVLAIVAGRRVTVRRPHPDEPIAVRTVAERLEQTGHTAIVSGRTRRTPSPR